MLTMGTIAGSMGADAQSLPKWVVHDISDVPPVAAERTAQERERLSSLRRGSKDGSLELGETRWA
jgi:hypothetical protein